MNRRTLVFRAASGYLLSGCSTTDRQPLAPLNKSYKEEVSSVLITADQKNIVFLGKSFTYVFPAPAALIDAFKASFYRELRAHARFDASGTDVWGAVDLELSDGATADQKRAAEAAGYRRTLPPSYYEKRIPALRTDVSGLSTIAPVSPSGSESSKFSIKQTSPKPSDYILNRRVILTGQRYGPTEMTGLVAHSLNQTYQFEVTENMNSESASVPSPVQRGGNGLLILLGIPLIVLLMFVGVPIPGASIR